MAQKYGRAEHEYSAFIAVNGNEAEWFLHLSSIQVFKADIPGYGEVWI